MKLYGSQPSPYVRRIRLALSGRAYQFEALDVFAGAGREKVIRHNPARKIPVLEDGDLILSDSSVIYRYLAEKFAWKPLSWDQENQLTTINAANDSLVELLLCKRSGFDIEDDKLFFNLQRERIAGTLAALNQQVKAGVYDQWQYPAMCLYSLADWSDFRDLLELDDYPALLAFRSRNVDRPGVAESDPRLSAS